jgi:hypothetical protein
MLPSLKQSENTAVKGGVEAGYRSLARRAQNSEGNDAT